MALPIASLLVKTPITPNQLTLLSFLLSIVSAFLYSIGKPLFLIIGSGVLFISLVLDNVDGSLARMRGTSSNMGRWLDQFSDEFGKVLLFAGIIIGVYRFNQGIEVWLLGFLGLAASLIIGEMYAAFLRLFPNAFNIIEQEKKKRSFLKQFFYLEPLIYNSMIVAGLLNVMYYFLIFSGIYGFIFAIALMVKLTKKGKSNISKKEF